VRTGGSVWCWGSNGSGQLGDNTTNTSPAAVQVVDGGGQPLTGAVSVAGGECSTCALDQAGGVWCWGCNGSGSLGDGTTTGRPTAAPVLDAPAGAPFANARALHVGGGHVCVERDAGEVWCWGQNNNGQIGDDTTDAKLSPVLSTFTGTVATGRWHTCGVGADTTVMCWGWGGHGRLANGVSWDPPDFHVPTPIATTPGGPPLTGARAVAAGAQSCAVMIDGTARCWGDDQYGQVGVGGGTGSPLPVVDGKGGQLGGIARMWAQHTRACAQLASGAIVCWGRNVEGELADPSLVNHVVPTPIGLTCQ
jgi:alpha-tubulin suppressor-like RCC1 family protein